jgi:hypothetical protein
MKQNLGREFIPSFACEVLAHVNPVVAFIMLGDEAIEP